MIRLETVRDNCARFPGVPDQAARHFERQDIMAATYDEIAEWWDNSEYSFSDYPPSAWFNYAEAEDLEIGDITSNPSEHEPGVAELHEAGDGRTCECEWAEHENGCPEGSK